MRWWACSEVAIALVLLAVPGRGPQVRADDPPGETREALLSNTASKLRAKAERAFATGDAKTAVRLNEDALTILERLYPPEEYPSGDPDLAMVLIELAGSLKADGRSQAALPHCERAVKMCEAGKAEKAGRGGIRLFSLALMTLGSIEESLDRPHLAVPHMRRALALREKLYPKDDDILLAVTRTNLAVALAKAGLIEDAIEQATEACDLCMHLRAEKTSSPAEDRVYAVALDNRAALLQNAGRLPEALEVIETAGKIWSQLYPSNTPKTAQVDLLPHLNTRVSILDAVGQSVKGLEYLKQALEIAVEVYPRDKYPAGHPMLLTTVINLAIAMRKNSDLGGAISGSRWAVTLAEGLYPKKTFPTGHSLFVAAIKAHGLALLELGSGDLAEEQLVRAAEMCIKLYPPGAYPNGHHDLAEGLINAAEACRDNGHLDRAIRYLERAVEVNQKLYTRFPNGHPHLASSLSDLGGTLAQAGQGERALAHCDAALQMLRRLPGKDVSPSIEHAFDNLGVAYAILGRMDLAADCYVRADQVAQKLYPRADYPDGRPDIVVRFINIAYVYQWLNEPKKAVDYTHRAVKMTESLYPKRMYPHGHRNQFAAFNAHAVILAETGNDDGVLAAFKRTLELADDLYHETIYPVGHPDLAIVHYNIGKIYLMRKQPEKAVSHLEKSLRLTTTLLQRHAGQLPEAEALDYAVRLPLPRDTYLTATRDANHSAEMTYAAVWASRAAVTRVMQSRHFAANEPAGVKAARDKLAGIRAELSGARMLPVVVSGRDRQITDLTERADRAERELLAALPKEARLPAIGSPEHLAAALPAESAFVDILRHDDRDAAGQPVSQYTAFIVAPKAAVVRLPLGPAEPIDQAVNAWRNALVDWSRPNQLSADRITFEQQATAKATDLRKRVWDRLSPHLPAGRPDVPATVFLAVEGDLARFPFAAMPDGPDSGFLLDRYLFATVMHGPFLLEQLRAVQAARRLEKLLVVGGVDYGQNAVKPRFSTLDGSAKELQRLRDVLGEKARVLTGQEATASAVIRGLEQSDAAHVSTHGEFREQELRNDRRLAAAYREGLRGFDLQAGAIPGRRGVGARNPLGYVGLALTGANLGAGPDAGILTGEVIVGLRLQRLRLVVLSACETGLGDNTDAEGVRGLQRAFHLAGCSDVVATLWKVDDEATVALVNVFWDRVLDPKTPLPPARALWEAQRLISARPDLIPSIASRGPGQPGAVKVNPAKEPAPKPGGGRKLVRSHPYLWAAFILSGAGR